MASDSNSMDFVQFISLYFSELAVSVLTEHQRHLDALVSTYEGIDEDTSLRRKSASSNDSAVTIDSKYCSQAAQDIISGENAAEAPTQMGSPDTQDKPTSIPIRKDVPTRSCPPENVAKDADKPKGVKTLGLATSESQLYMKRVISDSCAAAKSRATPMRRPSRSHSHGAQSSLQSSVQSICENIPSANRTHLVGPARSLNLERSSGFGPPPSSGSGFGILPNSARSSVSETLSLSYPSFTSPRELADGHPVLPPMIASNSVQSVPSTSGSLKSHVSLFGEPAPHKRLQSMKPVMSYSFVVLPQWRKKSCLSQMAAVSSLVGSGFDVEVSMHALKVGSTQTDPAPRGKPSCVVLAPNSTTRLSWNVLTILSICYDAFVVPLDFFDIQEVHFLEIMAWITRIFWTLDMCISCITGYVKSDGDFEMRLKLIVRHYVRTWFCLDFGIIFIDWLHTFMKTQKTAAKMSKTLRVLRLLRMSRLLRMARAVRILDIVVDRTHSEKIMIMVDITKNLCIILTLIHVIACAWFAVGQGDGGWLSFYMVQHVVFWEQYSHCLYWSLTQFTGSPNIFPQNIGERFYTIAVLLVAFIMSTWFVSNLTSSMTRFHIITRGQQTQFVVLRRWLVSHSISPKLISRVQLNARHTLKNQEKRVPEKDVELLRMVSDTLLLELHYEIYAPWVMVHPFFHRCSMVCPKLLRRVCHGCMSTMNLCRGDLLFSAGEAPTVPRMFFCVSGWLYYKRGYRDLPATDEVETDNEDQGEDPAVMNKYSSMSRHRTISIADWFCEGAIWTVWIYLGTCQVAEDCQIITVDGPQFAELCNKYQSPTFSPGLYASEFAQQLNAKLPSQITDIGSKNSCKILVDRAYGEDEESNWSASLNLFRKQAVKQPFQPAPDGSWPLSEHLSCRSGTSWQRSGFTSWLSRIRWRRKAVWRETVAVAPSADT